MLTKPDVSATPPSAQPIFDRIGRSFEAIALLSALDLDLFGALERRQPASIEDIVAEIGSTRAKVEPLVLTLAKMNLIASDNGRHSLVDTAKAYLTKDSGAYLGNLSKLVPAMWEILRQTGDSVRSGKPAAGVAENKGQDLLTALPAVAIKEGPRLAEYLKLHEDKSLLDVAGGLGALLVGILQAVPDLDCTLVELPETAADARAFLCDKPAGAKVHVAEHDILAAPYDGLFDTVIMRHFCQTLSSAEAAAAIANAAKSVAPGGRLVIVGWSLDEGADPIGLAYGMNLMFANLYEAGGCHAKEDYSDWVAAAGLEDFEWNLAPRGIGLPGLSIISGRQPGEPAVEPPILHFKPANDVADADPGSGSTIVRRIGELPDPTGFSLDRSRPKSDGLHMDVYSTTATLEDTGAMKVCQVRPNVAGYSAFEIISDDATTLGGDDAAPGALSFFAAGLSFCFLSFLKGYIKSNGLRVRSIRLEQKMSFISAIPGMEDENGGPMRSTAKQIDKYVVIDSEESDTELNKAIAAAEAACMATQSLINPTPVRAHLIRA